MKFDITGLMGTYLALLIMSLIVSSIFELVNSCFVAVFLVAVVVFLFSLIFVDRVIK